MQSTPSLVYSLKVRALGRTLLSAMQHRPGVTGKHNAQRSGQYASFVRSELDSEFGARLLPKGKVQQLTVNASLGSFGYRRSC